jgi:hypothetical protein
MPSLLDSARSAWRTLAGLPEAFAEPGASVVVQSNSPLAPRGWVGIVALGDAALVTAPTEKERDAVEAAVRDLDLASATWPADIAAALNAAGTLGPAELFFGDTLSKHLQVDSAVVTAALDAPAIQGLLTASSHAEVEESGLREVTSPVFAICESGTAVSACAYALWPGNLAHISVLTDAHHRRRGLGRLVAAAAIAHALAQGRLVQWRAQPYESQQLARSLGLEELGTQFCVRLPEGH